MVGSAVYSPGVSDACQGQILMGFAGLFPAVPDFALLTASQRCSIPNAARGCGEPCCLFLQGAQWLQAPLTPLLRLLGLGQHMAVPLLSWCQLEVCSGEGSAFSGLAEGPGA